MMGAVLWLMTLGWSGWWMIKKMRKWGAMSRAGEASGYEKRQEPDGWKFSVTPNKDTMRYRGSQVLIFIMAVPVSLWMVAIISEGIFGALERNALLSEGMIFFVLFLIVFLLSLFAASATRHFLRKASDKVIRSKPSTFLVNSESITIDGKRFHKDSIARLTSRNIISAGEFTSSSSTVISTSNLSSAAAGTFASIQGTANAYKRERLRLIAFMVFFESGGNAHFLASGLNETQAYGLMKEIGDILGFASTRATETERA